MVERFRGGTLVGDTLVGIGADRRNALRHGRLVGIVPERIVPPETVSCRSGQTIRNRSSLRPVPLDM